MPTSHGAAIRPSEITPKAVWLRRRELLAGATALGLASSFPEPAAATALTAAKSPLSTDEAPTPLADITSYNNFYEFGTDKGDPAQNADKLTTHPWTVKVDGLVAKPAEYQLEDILKRVPAGGAHLPAALRRGWSMVIPWIGFPLADLLKRVEPRAAPSTSRSRPCAAGRDAWPERSVPALDWPYVEGLRLDEAMHPLTILAVGLYGETLPNQNGAPIRLVVPWKYGFKSIKSIVRISLVEDEPPTTWNKQTRASTASIPTSTPRSTTRAGARRPSARSARAAACSPSASRRCHSTATPIRSHRCTPAWICARTSEMAAARPRTGRALPWYQRPRPGACTWWASCPPPGPLSRRHGPARPRPDEAAGAQPRPMGVEVSDRQPRDNAAASADRASACCATAVPWACWHSIYACLHLTAYALLDQGLDLRAIWADIVKRPYITIGMAALLVLIPLAVTSNNAMIRRLGGPAWQKLHRWVYLAIALAVVHFVMVAKVWTAQSFIYVGLVLFLLGYRLVDRLMRPRRAARVQSGPASVPQRVVAPVHQ